MVPDMTQAVLEAGDIAEDRPSPSRPTAAPSGEQDDEPVRRETDVMALPGRHVLQSGAEDFAVFPTVPVPTQRRHARTRPVVAGPGSRHRGSRSRPAGGEHGRTGGTARVTALVPRRSVPPQAPRPAGRHRFRPGLSSPCRSWASSRPLMPEGLTSGPRASSTGKRLTICGQGPGVRSSKGGEPFEDLTSGQTFTVEHVDLPTHHCRRTSQWFSPRAPRPLTVRSSRRSSVRTPSRRSGPS